jgi:hypothetical protein
MVSAPFASGAIESDKRRVPGSPLVALRLAGMFRCSCLPERQRRSIGRVYLTEF